MELDRITRMKNFVVIFSNAIGNLTLKMQDVSLLIGLEYIIFFYLKVSFTIHGIDISPTNDIIHEARTNAQQLEAEIFLYDIYVCLKCTIFLFY